MASVFVGSIFRITLRAVNVIKNLFIEIKLQYFLIPAGRANSPKQLTAVSFSNAIIIESTNFRK
jgi:hypothetical protein